MYIIIIIPRMIAETSLLEGLTASCNPSITMCTASYPQPSASTRNLTAYITYNDVCDSQTCFLILSHPVALRKTAFQDLDMCTVVSLAKSPTEIQRHKNQINK